MEHPQEVGDADARGAGPSLRQAGREAAVEGLLFGESPQQRPGRCTCAQRSARRGRGWRPASRTHLPHLAPGARDPARRSRRPCCRPAGISAGQPGSSAGQPGSSANRPGSSSSGTAVRTRGWRRALRRAHPATLVSAAVAAMLVVAFGRCCSSAPRRPMGVRRPSSVQRHGRHRHRYRAPSGEPQ